MKKQYVTLVFAMLAMSINSCTKKCESFAETTTGDGQHFVYNGTGGAPIWAKAGSWKETSGKISITASSFDATAFTKFMITYALTDLDSTDGAGNRFTKALPNMIRYTSPANVEFTNPAVAYIKLLSTSSKKEVYGVLNQVPLNSVNGSFVYDIGWKICN
jgi:hypothetical protein